ncbi:MAG: hypothetical protein JST93_23075 [Acidobacteria bacterium]|nr:hypothetical protein [Acidobacteriota bacterium]
MRDVESRVKEALQSGSVDTVRDGLSNVLYWGYAQIGYRSNRIQRFRELVTVSMLESAAVLFKQRSPSVIDIMELKLPEFSGLSFVSKIRMFLDPERSAVLDKQILKMNKVAVGTVLSGLSGNGTSISITQKHAQAYEQWCQKLLDISIRYFEAKPRAVDVERGFFHLIQTERVEIAATLLRDA